MSLSKNALAYYIGGTKSTISDKHSSFDKLELIKEAGVETHSSEFANSLNDTFILLHGRPLFS